MRTGIYGIHLVEVVDEPGDGTMMIKSITGENIGDHYQNGEYLPATAIIVCADQVEEVLEYEHISLIDTEWDAQDRDSADQFATAESVRRGLG